MAKTPAAPVPADEHAETNAAGKGRATPTRAEQEAARKRPLVADTKEAKARARAELAASRDKARLGMAAGDERYLPARDKGPQRRYVRDFVDAGWHLGEFVMPMMVHRDHRDVHPRSRSSSTGRSSASGSSSSSSSAT